MYKEDLAARVAASEAAERERNNRREFSKILDEYDVTPDTANYKMIVEYCGGEITLEKFQMLMEMEPTSITWNGTRDAIIGQIVRLLYDPKQVRMNHADLENITKSMQFWPKARLRARLAEVTYKQELAAQPVAQIKADLAAHRRAEIESNPWYPYAKMPKVIVPVGSVQQVPFDKRYLLSLSLYEFKRVTERFGSDQVTARLQGRA